MLKDILNCIKEIVSDIKEGDIILKELQNLLVEEMLYFDISEDSNTSDLDRKSEEETRAISERAMGYMYHRGCLDKIDQKKAKECYHNAIKNGDEDAIIGLGILYLQKGNKKRALSCFQEMANRDNWKGHVCLGYLKLTRWFKEKDMAMAWDLFLNAADKGSGLAQYILGELHENGRHYGLEVDLPTALEWFHKSSNSGYKRADQRIKQLNENGVFFNRDYVT